MRNDLPLWISKYRVSISSLLVALVLAGGAAFFSLNNRHLASIAGTCLFPQEREGKVAELEALKSQAASIEQEIISLQQGIVSTAEVTTFDTTRIAELQSTILSDYALYLEEQNLNYICSNEDTDACSNATENYNRLVYDNNQKKEELAYLESGQSSYTGSYDDLSSQIDQKNQELSYIVNEKIPALQNAIDYAEDCTTTTEQCSNTDPDGNPIDDNRDGYANCEDSVCSSNPECQVAVYDYSNDTSISDGAGGNAGDDGGWIDKILPWPGGQGYIDPSLFPLSCRKTAEQSMQQLDTLHDNLSEQYGLLGRLRDIERDPAKINQYNAERQQIQEQISSVEDSYANLWTECEEEKQGEDADCIAMQNNIDILNAQISDVQVQLMMAEISANPDEVDASAVAQIQNLEADLTRLNSELTRCQSGSAR